MFNKVLIGLTILLGSILIITNFAASSGFVHIIIGYAKPGMLAMVGIGIGFMGGFGFKGYLIEHGKQNYDEENDF
ncbi:hypothetical protein LR004_01920 [Candidatus Gracilibacteria bacterium]|nr:hypothetical protein [Candidatus Gracilibacteria bacterium]